MDGHEYEYACAQYLKRNGFTKVQVTKASGDQGIDIIATKGKKYGINVNTIPALSVTKQFRKHMPVPNFTDVM